MHPQHEVDKNLFFEFDSGGSRCGPDSGGVRWGPVGYLVIPELISVRDGLSDISFSDGSMFAYDDMCDLT